ncbi:AAA family ATPase [Allobaculum sp. JKK-2023]|uniref:SF1B family DNA helicase RecD2 n=1 Tax=Allobaculum sp. JKK-2023 TaxID=3108943 RepID=UPI002B052CC6|nr:AAA family ATPase [Allobaculum sp. JKK-2023]
MNQDVDLSSAFIPVGNLSFEKARLASNALSDLSDPSAQLASEAELSKKAEKAEEQIASLSTTPLAADPELDLLKASEQPEWPVFTGQIERIYFNKPESGFVIGVLREEQMKKTIRFKGTLPGCEVGQLWQIQGDWVHHEKYGDQIAVDTARQLEKSFDEDLIRFFSSKRFPGVGKTTAKKIVDALGEGAITTILQDPSVLTNQCQLSEKLAYAIKDGLRGLGGKGQQIEQMLRWGLSQKDINLIQQLPDDMQKNLLKDPYWAFYNVRGFGYESSSKLADGCHVSKDDPRRIEASVYHQLREMVYHSGSTAISRANLAGVCQTPEEVLNPALKSLAERKIVTVRDNFVYLSEQYQAELLISALMYTHLFQVEAPAYQTIEAALRKVEKRYHIQYDKDQHKAVHTFLNNSMMILNGGPGTGKSTLLKGLLAMIREFYPNQTLLLCAPTGRAAKRMNELSGRSARTIHSLLGWDADLDAFARDENHPLSCDFLVVDEMSMVDNRLFSSLLRALPAYCRILLIGDEDQLESVGPGNVLRDLIESGKVPVVRLETLHRQKKGSGISLLASEIRNNRPVTFENPVTFLDVPQDQTMAVLEQVINQQEDPDSMQILAPRYGGQSGIHEINAMMQKIINPFSTAKPEIAINVTTADGRRAMTFRQGDKVLLKINMAELDVYNGDIGEITSVDPMTGSLICEFNGIEVEFTKQALYHTVTHAWCISIHKSQGSEYPNVCLIADYNGGSMLRKRLLYTAVSRGKANLTIVGSEMLFRNGVRTQESDRRQTTLQLRMNQYWQYMAKKL